MFGNKKEEPIVEPEFVSVKIVGITVANARFYDGDMGHHIIPCTHTVVELDDGTRMIHQGEWGKIGDIYTVNKRELMKKYAC